MVEALLYVLSDVFQVLTLEVDLYQVIQHDEVLKLTFLVTDSKLGDGMDRMIP